MTSMKSLADEIGLGIGADLSELGRVRQSAARRALAALVAECDAQRERIQELEKGDSRLSAAVVAEAAETLYEFLWNERETFAPEAELLDQGFVAMETSADYDKLERLTMALGVALGHDPDALTTSTAAQGGAHPSSDLVALRVECDAANARADENWMALKFAAKRVAELEQALARLASMEGFEGAGYVGGDSFVERELRARGEFAAAALRVGQPQEDGE